MLKFIVIAAVAATAAADASAARTMGAMVDAVFLNETLTVFSTNTPNRFYNSENGVIGAEFLFEWASSFAGSRLGNDVGVRYFNHPNWMQPSVIARIEGTTNEEAMVILGGHQDSTSNSPGADDDGSGSITNLAIFKIFMESGFEPERPIEIHWYAAEEAGLLGSREVAQEYKRNGAEVVAMLQVDMDAHREAFGITLATGPDEISNYHAAVIEAYSTECCGNGGPIPTRFGSAGGGSDHSSWISQGYEGVFGIEDPKSPFLHTSNDDMSNISIEYMAAYTPAALAFVVELSAVCPAVGGRATCEAECGARDEAREVAACSGRCGLICNV